MASTLLGKHVFDFIGLSLAIDLAKVNMTR